jgi:hypothetical protein
MTNRQTAPKSLVFSRRERKANSQTVGSCFNADRALRRRMLYPVELRALVDANHCPVRLCGRSGKRTIGDRQTAVRPDRQTLGLHPFPATPSPGAPA